MYKPGVMLKFTAQKMLERCKYKTWMMPRQNWELYSMLIIACNRLCPSDPRRAYEMLSQQLRFTRRGVNADPTKWRCADRESREAMRLQAVKLQGQLKDLEHCPVCNGNWTPPPELTDTEDLTEPIEHPEQWHSPPDMTQILSQMQQFEGNAIHSFCRAKDKERGVEG